MSVFPYQQVLPVQAYSSGGQVGTILAYTPVGKMVIFVKSIFNLFIINFNMTKCKKILGNRIIILEDNDKKIIVNPVDISQGFTWI